MLDRTQVSSSAQRTNGARPTSIGKRAGATFISDEEVAERAYQKFLARGSIHGFDQQDWVAAQEELVAEVFER
jgi:Protein of unknown function (DUF2934)